MATLVSTQILSIDHLNAIGTVTAEWAYLEVGLNFLLRDLVGLDVECGAAITTHMPFDARLDAITIIAKSRAADVLMPQRVDSYVARFKNLRKRRNDVVHGIWYAGDITRATKGSVNKDPTATKISTRGGTLKVSAETISPQAMIQVAEEIAQLAAEIHDFLGVIPDLVKPSR